MPDESKPNDNASGDAGRDELLKLLPDEFKADPAFAPYKNIGDLLKSYKEQQRLIGMDKIPVPKDTDPPEAHEAFWKRLGRPEKHTEYELPKWDEKALFQPEGVLVDKMKEVAHKQGLTKKQLAGLMEGYFSHENTRLQQIIAENKAEREKAESDLKKEWGVAWDRNNLLAKAAVEKLGGEDLKKFLDETQLGNHPLFVKAFSKIGQALAEDDPSGTFGLSKKDMAMTPAEARSEIANMYADSETMKILRNSSHPKHKILNDKLDGLYKYERGEA